VPADPFEDEFLAHGPVPFCAQINYLGTTIVGQEDCLFINVCTVETKDLLPVIVSFFAIVPVKCYFSSSFMEVV